MWERVCIDTGSYSWSEYGGIVGVDGGCECFANADLWPVLAFLSLRL